jgi:hypothetical protein
MYSLREKAQQSAWVQPKRDRRKMIQGAMRLNMHIIWCFRAKKKIEMKAGQQPRELGYMPIAADELVFEMAATALLYPGSMGRPTWQSELP